MVLTTKRADQLVKSGKPVTLFNEFYNETFTIVLVKRDRFNVYSAEGGKFDRKELQEIK